MSAPAPRPVSSGGQPTASRDQAMEHAIGRLLQVGVTLASTVVLLGGVLYLHAHAGQPVSYRVFHAEPSPLHRPLATLRSVASGNPAAIIQLGVLLLVATPVARVLFAGVAFAQQRDRLYTVIAAVVLAVLMLGLAGIL